MGHIHPNKAEQLDLWCVQLAGWIRETWDGTQRELANVIGQLWTEIDGVAERGGILGIDLDGVVQCPLSKFVPQLARESACVEGAFVATETT